MLGFTYRNMILDQTRNGAPAGTDHSGLGYKTELSLWLLRSWQKLREREGSTEPLKHRLGEHQLRLFGQEVEAQETGNDLFKGTKHAAFKSVYSCSFRHKKEDLSHQ